MRLFLASEFGGSAFKICASLKQEVLLGNKVLFIDTAARGEGWSPDPAYNKPLEDEGFVFLNFDLAGKSEQAVRNAMKDVAIIYVCGGNTFYLLEHMQKCHFPILIRERLEQGAIYIGSSAGSIVCTPDIAYIDVMDDPSLGKLESTKGLGLVDYLIVPHMDHPNQCTTAQKRCATYTGPFPLIALYDNQCLFVQNNVTIVL